MRNSALLLAIAFLTCWSTLASAQTRHPGHELIWSQPPSGGSAIASQFAPDVPFYAEAADDFVAPVTGSVVHLHWWGMYSTLKSTAPVIAVSQTDWDGSAARDSLDCSLATVVECGADSILSSNASGQTNVSIYGCSSWLEDGPEVVYALHILFPGTEMTASLSGMTADLDLFLLTACDPDSCVVYGNESIGYTFARAGTYYLVVDGYYGAVSNYELTIDCPAAPDKYFTIRVYADDPSPPATPQPGQLLYETSTFDVHEELNAGGNSYWADIPGLAVVEDGHYWVSVQHVMSWDTYGQWYWSPTAGSVQHPAVLDFDYVGVPRWTPIADLGYSNDLAFELSVTDSPVERGSWGTIKAMYR